MIPFENTERERSEMQKNFIRNIKRIGSEFHSESQNHPFGNADQLLSKVQKDFVWNRRRIQLEITEKYLPESQKDSFRDWNNMPWNLRKFYLESRKDFEQNCIRISV